MLDAPRRFPSTGHFLVLLDPPVMNERGAGSTPRRFLGQEVPGAGSVVLRHAFFREGRPEQCAWELDARPAPRSPAEQSTIDGGIF